MVVLMLEDLHKNQVAGLICSIERISDELTQTNVDKSFKFKDMKVKTMQDVCDHWDEFFKVLQSSSN